MSTSTTFGALYWKAPSSTSSYYEASLAGFNDPQYITRYKQPLDDGGFQYLIGKYHARLKRHKFRFPNPLDLKNCIIEDKYQEVLCVNNATKFDFEFELKWELVQNNQLPENAICFGINSDGSSTYAARAFQNKHGLINEESDYSSPGSFLVPKGNAGIGKAYIPYSEHTDTPSYYEVLTRVYTPTNNIADPTRTMAVNAAQAAYFSSNFKNYALKANLDESSLKIFTSFDIEHYSTKCTVSDRSDAIDYENYLNLAYLGLGGTKPEAPEVVLGFRGTISFYMDWVNDFLFGLYPLDASHPQLKVHSGFYFATQSLMDSIVSELETLCQAGHTQLTITGHSKGGAMANLAAYLIKSNPKFQHLEVSVYTFGAPKSGNVAFSESYDQLIPNSNGYVFESDLVPRLPFTQDQTYLFEYMIDLFNQDQTESDNESDKHKLESASPWSVIQNILQFVSSIQVNKDEVAQASALLQALNAQNAHTVSDLFNSIQGQKNWYEALKGFNISFPYVTNMLSNSMISIVILYLFYRYSKTTYDTIFSPVLQYREELTDLYGQIDTFVDTFSSIKKVGDALADSVAYETVGNLRYVVSYNNEIQFLKQFPSIVSFIDAIAEYESFEKLAEKPINDHGRYVKILSNV